jgi:hypothetical protein
MVMDQLVLLKVAAAFMKRGSVMTRVSALGDYLDESAYPN